MKKAIYDEMEGFKSALKIGKNFDLWARVALKYKIVLFNLNIKK
jgi:hypothetical protein